MTDSQWLLLVLVVVYLTDCLAWADLYSVGFSSWWRRWRLARPGAILGNERGGLLVNPPLPPLGLSLIARPWPVSLSPEGLCSSVAQSPDLGPRPPQEERYHRFGDVRSVESVSKDVWINGSRVVRTDRPVQARRLAELVARLAAAPAEEREALIDAAMVRALDGQAIRARVDTCRRLSSPLVWMCNLLFAVIFVAGPLLVWGFGWLRTWRGLLLALFTALGMTVWEYYRAHRELYPLEPGERRLHAAVMCLNPLAAVRARDALSRDLLPEYHPLAVARALCPRAVFIQFARQTYLDARTPAARPDPTPEAGDIQRWFDGRLCAALEGCIREAGIDPEVLLRPDRPDDETCRSYCPRCQTQFELEDGACSSCGGIPLQGLAAARADDRFYPVSNAL